MEGHILIIPKTLYKLHASGKWFHKSFANMLHIEVLTPCKVNSDVWMQYNSDTHEYVAVSVDDLLCAMKYPRSFLNHLIQAN